MTPTIYWIPSSPAIAAASVRSWVAAMAPRLSSPAAAAPAAVPPAAAAAVPPAAVADLPKLHLAEEATVLDHLQNFLLAGLHVLMHRAGFGVP